MAEHTAKEDQWWRVTAEVYRLARWLDDSKIHNQALLVPAGNELRNATFFGLRTTRNGFVGLLVLVIPLLLQKSVTADGAARAALTPNAVRVIGYDLPWTCALWRRNHASHLPVAMASKLVERPPPGCDGLSAAEAFILFSNVPTRVAPIRQLGLRQEAANQGYRSDQHSKGRRCIFRRVIGQFTWTAVPDSIGGQMPGRDSSGSGRNGLTGAKRYRCVGYAADLGALDVDQEHQRPVGFMLRTLAELGQRPPVTSGRPGSAGRKVALTRPVFGADGFDVSGQYSPRDFGTFSGR